MIDDEVTLTPEARRSWLNVVKNLAHQGPGVHYEQPEIRGQPPRGSFRLDRSTLAALGDGDLKAGAAVAAGMFSIAPGDDPQIVQAGVVRDIGHGDIKAGRRVLERFAQRVRHGGGGVVLEHDGLQHDDGHHGWRVARR